jgi:hypothetical protein
MINSLSQNGNAFKNESLYLLCIFQLGTHISSDGVKLVSAITPSLPTSEDKADHPTNGCANDYKNGLGFQMHCHGIFLQGKMKLL